jgi:hypothetical protein
MKLLKISLLGVALLFTLGAVSCSGDTEITSVGQVSIATGLALYNQPANEVSKIATSTETIYLSAEVVRPTRLTRIRVKWYQLPSKLLASQDFTGRREGSNKFDFNNKTQSSFLASSISRDTISWPIGEYRAEVFIDNELAKTMFFNIVTEVEASTSRLAAIVRSVKTGDALNGQFKLANSKTVFTRTADNIYVQTSIKGAEPSTDLAVRVRYVKENRTFADFSYKIIDDKEIVVDLARERFGKLWSDKLWPVGTFEAMILVNNVEVSSHTFFVRGV